MNIVLKENQKVFFASDFHLGAPSLDASKKREEKIIRWLNTIEKEAAAIFLVGDIFDFWFEYDKVIPKGYIRFMGKIASLKDRGIPIIFFNGNHDLWMNSYFTEELGIPVYPHPLQMEINHKKFLIGHGDGLGPGDKKYKVLKTIFTNKTAQWFFKWLHPDIGIRIAKAWSNKSRLKNVGTAEELFKGDDEWLWQYCKRVDQQMHFDFYIFGHRHLPLELPVGKDSKYINLGEWVSQYTYGVFDGKNFELKKYKF